MKKLTKFSNEEDVKILATLSNFDWSEKFEKIEEKNSKIFQCKECDTQLTNQSSNIELAAHWMIHTGEKPFSCRICKRKFRAIPIKDKHFKRKHLNNSTNEKITAE